MNILIESMTKAIVPWAGLTIRCWRQEESFDVKTNEKTKADIDKFMMEKYGGDPLLSKSANPKYEIADGLLKLDRMNAVEVLDGDGNGVVLYADWP